MVEYSLQLDSIFSSLADATRRDILRQVSKKGLSISEIAKHYKLLVSEDRQPALYQTLILLI